jgi:hypothetical protein
LLNIFSIAKVNLLIFTNSTMKPVYSIKLKICVAIMCDYIDYDLKYRHRIRSKITEEDQDLTRIDQEEIKQEEQPIAMTH